MFNKKITPPTQPFKKAKISPTAVDNFAQNHISDNGSIPYVFQSGKAVKLSGTSIILSSNGIEHYKYLLGQTAPYHIQKQTTFPLKYIAYTLDENGKLVPWCTNSKVMSQFVTIGQALGYVIIQKGPNNELTIERVPGVEPVTHTERTHTDD